MLPIGKQVKYNDHGENIAAIVNGLPVQNQKGGWMLPLCGIPDESPSWFKFVDINLVSVE